MPKKAQGKPLAAATKASPAPNPLPGVAELRWVSTHEAELMPYRGQYVAILGDQIIAHGDGPEDVLSVARARDLNNVLLYFVPTYLGKEVMRIL